MTNQNGITCALVSIVLVVLSMSGCGGASKHKVKPFNRVVILIDASTTMMRPDPALGGKVPFNESLRLLQDYFVRTADQKKHRWDLLDDYHIVAVDAHSQEIWRGDRKALASLTPEELSKIFATRNQFAGCTSIGSAFEEAAQILNKDPEPSGKYLLSFSDLLDEPPTSSYKNCARPSGNPPEISWDKLSDVSLSFYWVSSDFRYQPDQHWRERLQQVGLADVPFSNAAQTVSRGIALNPPPRARRKPTQEEADRSGEKLEGAKSSVLWLAGAGTLTFTLILGGVFIFSRLSRQRKRRIK